MLTPGPAFAIFLEVGNYSKIRSFTEGEPNGILSGDLAWSTVASERWWELPAVACVLQGAENRETSDADREGAEGNPQIARDRGERGLPRRCLVESWFPPHTFMGPRPHCLPFVPFPPHLTVILNSLRR